MTLHAHCHESVLRGVHGNHSLVDGSEALDGGQIPLAQADNGAAEPGASVQTEKADKQDYQRDEYEPAEQFCEKFEVPQDDFLPKDKSNSCAKGTWEYERRR